MASELLESDKLRLFLLLDLTLPYATELIVCTEKQILIL